MPLVIIAWWTNAPGATRGMAFATAFVGVAYMLIRLGASGTWEVFEQDIGLGFSELTALTRPNGSARSRYLVYGTPRPARWGMSSRRADSAACSVSFTPQSKTGSTRGTSFTSARRWH